MNDDGLDALALQPDTALELIREVGKRGGFIETTRRGHPDARARIYAGMLASRGALDELDAALAMHGDEAGTIDLFACWAQELVMRGIEVGGPRIDALATALVARRHPLAELPMHRLELERRTTFQPQAYHPTYRSGAGCARAEGPELAPRAQLPQFVEMTVTADERIAAAFESHRTVSNGRSEHRVFALDPPVPMPADPALLAALPLACLEGGFAGRTSVIAATAEEVLGELLAFATVGGDYNTAWSSAYGRRDAWRSFGGLIGAPPGAALHEIETLARSVHWTRFSSETAWFYNVVTDLGVAAVSTDGSSLAILAGTDTD